MTTIIALLTAIAAIISPIIVIAIQTSNNKAIKKFEFIAEKKYMAYNEFIESYVLYTNAPDLISLNKLLLSIAKANLCSNVICKDAISNFVYALYEYDNCKTIQLYEKMSARFEHCIETFWFDLTSE